MGKSEAKASGDEAGGAVGPPGRVFLRFGPFYGPFLAGIWPRRAFYNCFFAVFRRFGQSASRKTAFRLIEPGE